MGIVLEFAVVGGGLLAASYALSGLYDLYRGVEYRTADAMRRSKLQRVETSGEIPPEQQRFKAVAALFYEEHAVAKQKQTRYQRTVAVGISALMVAFLFFAAEATFLPETPEIHRIGVQVDLSALFIAFVHTFLALWLNRRWVIQRTFAELLRQNALIEEALSVDPTLNVTERYEQLSSQIRAQLPRKVGDLNAFVGTYWKSRTALIRRESQAGSGRVGDFLNAYIDQRGRAQLAWFEGSQARLEAIERLRGGILLALFGLATVVSITKLVLMSGHSHDQRLLDGLTFVFLVCIGLSTALTGLYFSQNARSLIHRYRTQIRKITDQVAVLEAISKAPAATPVPAAGIVEAMIGFEDLMVEELIDWIEITRRDVAEVSTS